MQPEFFDVPVGQRQLFIDDFGIEEIKNLTREMHQPRKLGAVIRPDRSIGITSHQTRTAPVWDPNEKIYKFLVHGRPDDMDIEACSYFESNDGLHWTKPSLNHKMASMGTSLVHDNTWKSSDQRLDTRPNESSLQHL